MGQIWSQLPPIGLPGLNSWSPHTLVWYNNLLPFASMYHLNPRAGKLLRSASSHFLVIKSDLVIKVRLVRKAKEVKRSDGW